MVLKPLSVPGAALELALGRGAGQPARKLQVRLVGGCGLPPGAELEGGRCQNPSPLSVPMAASLPAPGFVVLIVSLRFGLNSFTF